MSRCKITKKKQLAEVNRFIHARPDIIINNGSLLIRKSNVNAVIIGRMAIATPLTGIKVHK